MGNNPLLEGWTCDDYYQCNKYIDNKDIIFVLSQIYEYSINLDIKKFIIEIVKKNDSIHDTSYGANQTVNLLFDTRNHFQGFKRSQNPQSA